jgi:hypothetical protein
MIIKNNLKLRSEKKTMIQKDSKVIRNTGNDIKTRALFKYYKKIINLTFEN